KGKLDPASGTAPGAIEVESLSHRPSAGRVLVQKMTSFKDDQWSGGQHLFWTGARPGDRLAISLPEQEGTFDLEVVMTCARDYGIVQLRINDAPLGNPIDLYNPSVITTGVLSFPGVKLGPGPSTLTVQIVGANPRAV